MPQIIIKRADGGVSIGPFKGDPGVTFEKWKGVARPSELPATYRVSDTAVVRPANRVFRNAWTDDVAGLQIDVNMDKARGLKLVSIRVERDSRLDVTDTDVLRLDGSPVSPELKAKRQALRDIPTVVQPDLDAIETPEELEAYEPAWP